MKLRELKALIGDRPFVWRSVLHPEWIIASQFKDGREYTLSLINETTGNCQDVHDGYEGVPVPNEDVELHGIKEVLDYFDNSTTTVTVGGPCKCEWVDVLQNGCRCGAIIPYGEKQ